MPTIPNFSEWFENVPGKNIMEWRGIVYILSCVIVLVIVLGVGLGVGLGVDLGQPAAAAENNENSCEDKHIDCPSWESCCPGKDGSNASCSKEDCPEDGKPCVGTWMKQNCPKTCKTCGS